MIADPRVFEETFVPRDVEHRDREATRIEQALAPVVEGDPGSNVYLFGPTGTGKTTVARYLLAALDRTAPALRSHYVNCWRHSSRYDVLFRAAEGMTGAADIHRTATPADDLAERLEAVEEQMVLVLDEVDRLAEPDVLYDLYHVPGLAVMLIANREAELFGRLPERVASRLRVGHRIEFAPYAVDQLVGILGARVRAGLQPGAIDARRVERIAREADGDARVAIAVLHAAAQLATARNADAITDAVLDDALPRAEEAPAHPGGPFGEHERALLDVLGEADGGVQPKRLYAAYAERLGADARSRRTVQKYLNELVRRGAVEEEGASQSRRYHAAGARSTGSKPT